MSDILILFKIYHKTFLHMHISKATWRLLFTNVRSSGGQISNEVKLVFSRLSSSTLVAVR